MFGRSDWPMAELEDLLRNLVNDLPSLPEDGIGPPSQESLERKPIRDGESPVMLQKIITEIYVFTSTNGDNLWYGAQSFQDVQLLGQMRLSEALKIIESRKTKKAK